MVTRIAKRAILPVIFLIVSLTLAGILLYQLLYTDAFVVMVDDEVWGYVTDTDDIDEQIQEIEYEVGEIRNEDYNLKADIEYEPAVVLNTEVSDGNEIHDYLYDTVDEITDNYVLNIKGQAVGMGDYTELSKMVEDIKESYVNENTISAEIMTDYDIDYETVPSETDEDISEITETLVLKTQAPVVYMTQEGDTLESILEKENLSETELFTLNPQIEKTTNEDEVTIVTLKAEPEEDVEEEETSDPQTEDIEETEDVEDTENTENEEINERAIEAEVTEEQLQEIQEDETVEQFEDTSEDTRQTVTQEEAYGPDYSNDEEFEESTDIEETDSEITDEEEVEEEIIETPIDEGIELLVVPEKSSLVVETHETSSYERAIEYKTEIIETDELYEGEQQTTTLGKNGTLIVSEESVFENGTKIDQFETSREITEEPVNEVIYVGTKEIDPNIGKEPEVEITVEQVIEAAQEGVYYTYNYIWPLSNYGTSSISSGFGWRVLNGSSENHQGIDISAPNGTPIMASKDGTVITNTYNSGRGWYVQIDHGDGYITTYQHMNAQSSVVVGTQVKQGQVIGYVGNTGYSFGNHLHFEVWVNTGSGYQAIDPMNLFNSATNYVVVSTDTSSEVSDDVQSLREEIVEYAKQYIGCPYVHAGHGPDVFDCSGFVGYVYRHFGYDMPYYVEGELAVGTPVSCDVSEMEPGDIIFFATTGTGEATHVGIYIGNGQYIHASSTYGVVQIATAQSTANRPIVAVRRVVD